MLLTLHTFVHFWIHSDTSVRLLVKQSYFTFGVLAAIFAWKQMPNTFYFLPFFLACMFYVSKVFHFHSKLRIDIKNKASRQYWVFLWKCVWGFFQRFCLLLNQMENPVQDLAYFYVLALYLDICVVLKTKNSFLRERSLFTMCKVQQKFISTRKESMVDVGWDF